MTTRKEAIFIVNKLLSYKEDHSFDLNDYRTLFSLVMAASEMYNELQDKENQLDLETDIKRMDLNERR